MMQTLLHDLKTFYKREKRDFPWRETHNPYRILVSEIMLQQTQVSRVVPFYNRFIKKFPTARALSHASFSEVLKLWQGLGYNRRAKYLHEASKLLSGANVSRGGVDFFESLPGVGPYTARAVSVFAYNKPEVFIETNIRTVFLYHCFDISKQKHAVADSELLPLVAEALHMSHMKPREFYAALMDYGSYLKQNGVRLNNKSAHYVKQKAFKGSTRELRGILVKELLNGSKNQNALIKKIASSAKWRTGDVKRELSRLEAEGLLRRNGGNVMI